MQELDKKFNDIFYLLKKTQKGQHPLAPFLSF